MPPPSLRPVARAVRAQELLEGAGVLVRRTVGAASLRSLDPFLLCDHLCSSVAAAAKGFPEHPHRGQTTVSVMLRGGMRHRDSLGNEGVVGDGGVPMPSASVKENTRNSPIKKRTMHWKSGRSSAARKMRPLT